MLSADFLSANDEFLSQVREFWEKTDRRKNKRAGLVLCTVQNAVGAKYAGCAIRELGMGRPGG